MMSNRYISGRGRDNYANKDKGNSKGLCGFCRSEIDKSRMTQHLKSCKQRAAANAASLVGREEKKQKLLLIQVEGKYKPQYWTYIEIAASEPLATLDQLLRYIWVECCDHLSAFRIDGTIYEDEREPEDFSFLPGASDYEGEDEVEGEDGKEDMGEDEEDIDEDKDIDEEEEEEYEDLSPEEIAEVVEKVLDIYVNKMQAIIPAELDAELRKPRSRDDLVAFLKEKLKIMPKGTFFYAFTDDQEMRSLYDQQSVLKVLLNMVEDRSLGVPLEKVLSVGQKFTYEYDYGDTTYLNLRVISEREGVIPGMEEGKDYAVTLLARNVAPVFLCKTCGKPATKVVAGYYNVEENAYCDECAERSEDVDMMLPVVNSPRVGVCGYCG